MLVAASHQPWHANLARRLAARTDTVYDRIRMLDAEGYPPAFLTVGDIRLEFTRASRLPDCVGADVRITFPGTGKAER